MTVLLVATKAASAAVDGRFLRGQHVLERVVERAEIRRDFFVKVAGQKTQGFTRLNGRASENDARDLSLA